MPGRHHSSQITPRTIVSLGLVVASLLAFAAIAAAEESHPLTADDLVRMDRISDPQVSPDGRSVVYVLRSTDLEADGGKTDLWTVPADGDGTPRRLTSAEGGDWHPRFSPDGKSVHFLSTRSGDPQVWRLPLSGGEALPVTNLPLGVSGFTVTPDGGHLLVALDVFPDCEDLACTTKHLEERKASKRTGHLYGDLMVRHWDTWKDDRRSHLFVLDLDENGRATGEPVDLTAGFDADIPPKPWSGFEEVAVTPDGEGVVFTAKTPDDGTSKDGISKNSEAWTTNFDLYHAPLDGSAKPAKLTDNLAWDTHPVFSPDGRSLLYLAMSRPGYESDRFRLVLRGWPEGEERILAEPWDRSPSSLLFSPDGKTLYVTAQDHGRMPLFAMDIATGEVETLVEGGRVSSPGLAGDRLVYGHESLTSPVDLFALPLAGGEPERLTAANAERLAEIEFGEAERLRFSGWNGETVEGWLVKPANFDPEASYPVAFLIHGGPQGSWLDSFHYRWNPQIYAGAGYGVVAIDFHGSTGYGQAFTDAIRGDWGGKPLEDLQKGFAAALKTHPWLDGDRACALGASYGGYMINWIAGHWPGAFRCLVNHDGLFDLRSMYYSTEELWFPEHDFLGTPWENPEGYREHNPALFVERWETPMLVVHGELDYRVSIGQGLATFTALKRRGIPSQLLYFPDENHWVLKPNNSLQWHEVVLAWLDRWTGEK